MIGSLTYHDYVKLFEKNQIISNEFIKEQIQPSSIDLTLSEECYQIKNSFLSPKSKVRDKLKIYCKKNKFKKNIFLKKIKHILLS